MILLFVLNVLDNDKELFHHSNWSCRRIFPLDGADFLIGVFLTFHSNSTANRTWSTFAELCRRRFEEGIRNILQI